jgi:hypothetical protein
MKNRLVLTVFTFSLSLAFVASALAQGPGRSSRRGQRGDPQRMRIAHMVELIDNLDLTEEQALTLVPQLRKIKENMRTLMETSRDLMLQIKLELEKDEPDDEKLASMLKNLKQIRKDHFKLIDEEEGLIEQHLTVKQAAKYYLMMRRLVHKMMGKGMDVFETAPDGDSTKRPGLRPGFRPDSRRNR